MPNAEPGGVMDYLAAGNSLLIHGIVLGMSGTETGGNGNE